MTQVTGYTVAELKAQQLYPIRSSNSDDIVCFIERGDTLWQGDLNRYLKAVYDEGALVNRKVFRRCASAVKLNKEDCFFSLELFGRSTKGTWETSVRGLKNQVSQDQRVENRITNLPFLRMYAMGDVDAQIICPILKFPIDNIELFGVIQNAWVQHHFRFVNGNSVHKVNANVNPGAILSSTNFAEVTTRSREGLKDMARTIFLSATAHDALHRAKRDGDILDYTNEQLPWALRNADNWNAFNAFLGRFGHEPLGEYEAWFEEQKN